MMKGKSSNDLIVGGMLGEGVKMEGTLNFKQTFRIDGEFQGKIFGSERLVVGEKGIVKGEIECNSLICYGKITGNIKIKQDVEIHPKGRVEGDIFLESPLLTVLEGGSIDGTIKMAKKDNTILSITEKAK